MESYMVGKTQQKGINQKNREKYQISASMALSIIDLRSFRAINT